MIDMAITGASGFIGSRFVDLYGQQPEISLKVLTSANKSDSRSNYALDDYASLGKALKSVDVMIHCAFDHAYRVNTVGIKNILRACEENHIKRLVHLSTVSVYDPFIDGRLTENSPYSAFYDPYCREKRAIERIIDRFAATFEIVILQPAIVYGLGGNWTHYLMDASRYKKNALPDGGQFPCNAVYVDDVAAAIDKACTKTLPKGKVKCLISGREPVTWFDLYEQHSRLLAELGAHHGTPEIIPATENNFHNTMLGNLILTLWYKTSLGCFMNPVVAWSKNMRAKQYKSKNSRLDIRQILQKDLIDGVASPSGMTRLVHRSKFTVDISKAKALLDFSPMYSLVDGISALKEQLRG